MKATVIKPFIDKNTREGFEKGSRYQSENPKRIKELQEKGYLEADKADNYPKHTGGGWYELSDGSKVQGKKEATAAEKKLGD